MMNLLLEVFMKKNCKKLDKENLEVENAIKRKGDKLCIKWKGYDKSFNSWINKKTLNEIPCIKMSQHFAKVFKILKKI